MMSTTELWNVITGCSSLQDPESIGKELERFLPMLKVGLRYYEEPNSTSENKVRSSPNIKRKEFIIKLSKVLNLDEWFTHELFQNYLRLDFRGSGPQLQTILKHDSQLEGFYLKLLNFYFKERLHLLKSIKYLITYWQDDTCFYREEFAKIVDQLANQGFIDKIIQQLKELFKKPANHKGIKGNYTAETEFANEYMKEMCELVDIIFLYYKDFDMSVEVFLNLASLFKLHHFGYSHVNRKSLSSHATGQIDRFGYISSLVLLEGLDMELSRKTTHDRNSFKDHLLLKDDAWKKIDTLLYSWDDMPQQGPVLMAWTIFRHVYLPADEQQLTKIFGDAAMKCKIFEYLHSMLENPLYDEVNSGIPGLVKSFIYLTSSLALKIFQEGSLCDYQILITLASKVLSEPILSSLFLSEDQTGGLSLLLESSRKLFPFVATPYLKLLTSLCCDKNGTELVFESFDKLDTFTELFSKNTIDEIEWLSEKFWRRSRSRRILSHSKNELVLPGGTRGHTFQYKQETRVVEWKYSFSGWLYVLLEMNQIISSPFTYSNDCGEDGLVLAKHYIQFVNSILTTNPEKLQELEPIISAIIILFKRLMHTQTKPLEIISCCLECLHIVMQQQPLEIWESLTEVQFLPHQRSQIGSSVPTMWPGSFGEIILRTEIQVNTYKVTKVYLMLISQMLDSPVKHIMKDFSSISNKKKYLDITANLAFIIKELFATFGAWKFSLAEEKEIIGLYCLEIFHKILSPNFQEVTTALKKESLPSLKDTVVEGLSYHRAGDSLLSILAVGVDGLESAIENNNRQKANVIQVVKLSLAVLNLLLTKSGKSSTLTRLEELVSQQFVQQSSDLDFVHPVCKISLLSVIAKYIFHRNDSKLTILAVITLKTLSVRFPLILTACFGDALVGIRNAFVNKLNGRVEAVRLKVAILELLSASVESQPGIIESFTHIQNNKSNKSTLGKFSCLPAVMEILENKTIVDVLTTAALEFISALWYNRYDAAMMLLKKNQAFWESITHYVNILETKSVQPVIYEVIHYALDIITVESYYVKNSEFDETLETHLNTISTEASYERIGKLFSAVMEKNEMKKRLLLITSFHNYATIMFTTKGDYGNLLHDKIAEVLLHSTVNALKSWTGILDVKNLDLISSIIQELSNLLWTLVRNYKRTSLDYENALKTLCEILQELPKADKETFHITAQPLYSVLLFVVQNRGTEVAKGSWICSMFTLVCDRLHFHKDDESCIHQHHMQINKTSICLLNELANHIPSHSLQALVKELQSQGILRNLMHDVSSYLQKKMHMEYVENVLEFLLTCSQKELLVEHVYNSGFGKFVCLELYEVYHDQSEITQKIWCLILAITSHLLRKLRHTFLQTAIDFIGTYEEMLVKHMNVIESLSNQHGLQTTEQLAIFCCELSKYQLDVEFMLPQVFQKMKLGVGQIARLSIALLSRQKLVNHVIESQFVDSEELLNFASALSPVSVRSDNINSGHSCSEKVLSNAEAAFSRLISILCYSLASLRHLTPNVVETILDEGMDIRSFSPLVDLKFNSPSLELDDTPSFGSLISCINVSIKMIHKASQSESERATPERDTFLSLGSDPVKRRSSLWFVIENALIVIFSQASCYLRHPHIDEGAKQFLKRELGSELMNFMYAVYRFRTRRGVPPSPESASSVTSSSAMANSTAYWRSPSKLSTIIINEDEESTLLRLVDMYTKNLLR